MLYLFVPEWSRCIFAYTVVGGVRSNRKRSQVVNRQAWKLSTCDRLTQNSRQNPIMNWLYVCHVCVLRVWESFECDLGCNLRRLRIKRDTNTFTLWAEKNSLFAQLLWHITDANKLHQKTLMTRFSIYAGIKDRASNGIDCVFQIFWSTERNQCLHKPLCIIGWAQAAFIYFQLPSRYANKNTELSCQSQSHKHADGSTRGRSPMGIIWALPSPFQLLTLDARPGCH